MLLLHEIYHPLPANDISFMSLKQVRTANVNEGKRPVQMYGRLMNLAASTLAEVWLISWFNLDSVYSFSVINQYDYATERVSARFNEVLEGDVSEGIYMETVWRYKQSNKSRYS